MVSLEVVEGEEYGEGFLYVEEVVEGLFIVELYYWFVVGEVGGGDDVLVGVVVFGGVGLE